MPKAVLVVNKTPYSFMVEDIVAYAVDIVRRSYGIDLSLDKVYSDEAKDPILIIDDIPIKLSKNLPRISEIVDLIIISVSLDSTNTKGVELGSNELNSIAYT
ncbi:MAG: hypothetical protein DRO40_12350 [Thermoprotei archaeon]|nr:MAG: hypothetical protein DRO40_12350 [Thermoprotei archaeon]